MPHYVFELVLVIAIFLTKSTHQYYEEDFAMHPDDNRAYLDKVRKIRSTDNGKTVRRDINADYWFEKGQEAVLQRLRRQENKNLAKNVILFLGDGMSIPTLSAARAFSGGVDSSLSFENFPFTALSKTYCLDRQVADSACSATAYLCGIKANFKTIGVTGAVPKGDCAKMADPANAVDSIALFAQRKGKSTGFVTTSRVTHASPAGLYGHTADRDWESDQDVRKSGQDPEQCHDMATQLIRGKVGRNFNVILGGGRANFLPANFTDQEGEKGRRFDGLNLIDEWLQLKLLHGNHPEFVWNRTELLTLDYRKVTDLLGLFNSSHCEFNLNRNRTLAPSLEEMTESAIKILSQNKEHGFFLFVEGARIDMGHHESKAMKALDETLEFSKAVQKALDLTDDQDTLIVVTADHAHTLSYSGYAGRDANIFGIGGNDRDNLPYTILNYANGPGFKETHGEEKRHDLSHDNMIDNVEYQFPAVYPMKSETHGGDDVAVFAKGPWAHLFTGVMEQNVIPQLMEFAACIGDGAKSCDLVKSP